MKEIKPQRKYVKAMFRVWPKYVKQRKYMIVVWTLSLTHPLYLQRTETWQQYVREILKL